MVPAEAKILVVDDEPQIRRALVVGLSPRGYEVKTVATGEEALDAVALDPPEVMILDLTLPGMSGLEVCRRVREWADFPIIVLSVHGEERDKVAALEAGADDYVTKPFGLNELVARIRAVLRRWRGREEPEPAVFTAGDLVVDFACRVVSVRGEEVHLTPIEYDLLCCLVRNAGRVLTHTYLLREVWGTDAIDETPALRVHIGHLRQKIEPNPARPTYIITEPGIGYRFRLPA